MAKNILIVIGVIALSLIVASYFYLRQVPVKVLDQNTSAEKANKALEDVIATPKLNISTNPLENKLPELNPVEKTNPFNVYQNPFE